MTNCCVKHYASKRLFECCSNSNCIQVDVKPGQLGSIRIIDAPEGLCFDVHEVIWDQCCKNPTYACVTDECGEKVSLRCGDEASALPVGTYRICIYDEDCEPVVPDSGEVIAVFSQTPV